MKGHHVSPLGIWKNPKMVQELRVTKEQVKGVRESEVNQHGVKI